MDQTDPDRLVGRGPDPVALDATAEVESNATLVGRALADRRDRQGRWFVAALVAATLIPWLVLPLFGAGHGLTQRTISRIAFIAGPPHVIASYGLYWDPALRPLFKAERIRFVWAPIAIAVLCPVFFLSAPHQVASIAFVAALGWGAYHFGRQNLGVLAFIYAARGRPSPAKVERNILAIVGVAGPIAALAYSNDLMGSGGYWLRPVFLGVGAVGMAVAAVLSLPVLWRLRDDLVCFAFFVESVVFFAPLFFIGDPAAIPYAVAHGFQYLVFMAVLLKHHPTGSDRPVWPLVAATTLIFLIGGVILRYWSFGESTLFMSVTVATSAIHFLMDASLWRLRKPFQRTYVKERFTFLTR